MAREGGRGRKGTESDVEESGSERWARAAEEWEGDPDRQTRVMVCGIELLNCSNPAAVKFQRSPAKTTDPGALPLPAFLPSTHPPWPCLPTHSYHHSTPHTSTHRTRSHRPAHRSAASLTRQCRHLSHHLLVLAVLVTSRCCRCCRRFRPCCRQPCSPAHARGWSAAREGASHACTHPSTAKPPPPLHPPIHSQTTTTTTTPHTRTRAAARSLFGGGSQRAAASTTAAAAASGAVSGRGVVAAVCWL